MALQPAVKPVALFGGLDLKTDEKYVSADRTLTSENVRFPGVSRVQKRYGQSILTNSVPGSSTLIEQGKALGAYGEELLAFDGSNLFAYAEGSEYWVSRGSITESQLAVTNVTAGVNSAIDVSSASNGVLEVYAWADSNGNVYYSAKDAASGTFFVQNALLAPTATAPQVVLTPNYAYILANVAGVLTIYQFIHTSMASGPVQQQNLGGALTGTFHAMAYTDKLTLLVTYVPAAGSVTIAAYDATSLVLAGSYNVAVASAAVGARLAAASVTTSSNEYLTAFVQPGVSTVPTLYFSDQSFSSLPIVLTPTQPLGIAGGYTAYNVSVQVSPDANYIWAAAIELSGDPVNLQPLVYVAQGVDNTAVATTSAATPGLGLGGQMAYVEGNFYWLGASRIFNPTPTISQQTTYYLMGTPVIVFGATSAAAPALLSRFLYGQASPNVGIPASVSEIDGELFYGLPYRAVLRADATGTLFTSNYVTSVYIEFPTASSVQIVPFNNIALINCGLTYNYDGINLVENGFWEFPDGIVASTDSAGSTNQYQYFMTYEWTDAVGNVTYSAPSYPVYVDTTLEVGAGATNTLTVPYLCLSRKENIKIGIYRTTSNNSSPAFKIGTVANVATGTATTTFVDTVLDATAEAGQRLYAPADLTGELDNTPAPPFRYISASKTRVFGIPQDNPYQIWYSKPAAPGRPADFTAEQFIPIETAGGHVSGLSVIDTQAVVFKSTRVYYLPGDGPNAGGQPYNAFPSSLQLISSTTGCKANASVLVTAEGLFFQSKTGMTQLNRSLTLDPNFGMAIQPLVQSLTLTGAQAVPEQNQLRWVSAEGTCLVYDYVTRRWSTYTNYDGVGYQPYGDTFARLRTDGRVWYEDTSTYLDDGNPVTMTIETAWLKPAELAQGWAAVWYATVLGSYVDSHNLVVEVAFDYIDAPSDIETFDATTNGNFGFYGSGSPYGSDPYYGSSSSTPIAGTAYQVRFAMKRQVCESVKFTIYDNTITGASCTLNEIALQLGVIGGTKRLPSGQQI